jgi:hypothetical protein
MGVGGGRDSVRKEWQMARCALSNMVRASGVAGILLASVAAGCGGGSGGGSDPQYGAHDLYVVDMDLDGLDGVSLNTPLQIEFSDYLLPPSVRHDTIQIRLGPRYGIQSFGDFKVSGNMVTFYPQLPAKADLSDSGFKPQSQYKISVIGYPQVDHVASYTGKPLVRSFVGAFATAASTSLNLFTTDSYRDNPPPTVQFTNPPDVLPVSPWTKVGGAVDVPTDAEMQVIFNRVPLAPSTITATNISLTMISRLGIPQTRPIQGTPTVEQSFEGTTVRFVPSFPLADQAHYILRIENRVTDLTGSFDVADNAKRTALRTLAEGGLTDPDSLALKAFAIAHPEEVDPRVFLILSTRDEPTKDLTLFLNFDGTDVDQSGGNGLDKNFTTAQFNNVVPGSVAAGFTAAGGNGTLGDLIPASSTTLSTNSPSAVNGAFNFRTVDIKAGITLTVTGTLPGSILALTKMSVAGIIGATGTKGDDGESAYSTSTLPLEKGGAPGPGGGIGGDCYTGTTTYQGVAGNPGVTAANSGGKGGNPGKASTGSSMSVGGGGGGGGHQYAGSNGLNGNYSSSSWNGVGGTGGGTGGILPTSAATSDGTLFYQKGVGGGGGASGGNHFYSTWRSSAGAGGGGGGGLLLKSAGDITFTNTGQVVAKGGAGGLAGQYYYTGGGGGGGAGGAVAIYANGSLVVTGARVDTSGGIGGAPNSGGYAGGGGAGGGGYIELEDADGVITGVTGAGAGTFTPDYYTGKFDPTGTATDPPSVFTSTWFNTGVFDPILQTFNPLDFTEQNYPFCTIKYEMQMAIEDSASFGHANTTSITSSTGVSSDLNKASQWAVFKDPALGIQDITSLMNDHHYQFYRIRISFTLKDGQKRNDPVPYVDRLRFRIKY